MSPSTMRAVGTALVIALRTWASFTEPPVRNTASISPAALVELQLSVGFYIMTSKFLETFAVDLQPVTEVVG